MAESYDLTIRGTGRIEIIQVQEVNADWAVMLTMLSELNPAEIEERASARLGWGDSGTLTAKVLEVIMEMLSEIDPESGRDREGG